jgi:hypothetical protein
MGRDSSVCIATGYGLDGPGIESRWGARFFAHFHSGPGAHPASCTMGTASFPGIKRQGRGADQPPPSSAKVKKEYTPPPSGPSGLLRGNFYLSGCEGARGLAITWTYIGGAVSSDHGTQMSLKPNVSLCGKAISFNDRSFHTDTTASTKTYM